MLNHRFGAVEATGGGIGPCGSWFSGSLDVRCRDQTSVENGCQLNRERGATFNDVLCRIADENNGEPIEGNVTSLLNNDDTENRRPRSFRQPRRRDFGFQIEF